MALASKTLRILGVALANDVLAAEMDALLDTPGAASEDLSEVLLIAMTDEDARDEVVAGLASGASSVSARTGRILSIMMADEDEAKNIFSF